MRRDFDLSRQILFFIEEHAPPEGGLKRKIEIPGYDEPTIDAHAILLIEGGFVDGYVSPSMKGPVLGAIRKLTNAGHDAIEIARNDTTWHKAKEIIIKKGLPMTFNLLLEVAKTEAQKHLGLF